MLMPSSARASEHPRRDARVGAHANAHQRDLGDVVVARDAAALMSGFTFDSRIFIARWYSLRWTVNEKSVMPSVDAFWMIMSTSMLASAMGPRIA